MSTWRTACLAMTGALCWVAMAGVAVAESQQEEESKRLEQVENALAHDQAKAAELANKAKSLKAEVEALRKDMVAAAKKAQDLEDEISAKEASLAELEVRRVAMLAALNDQRSRLTRTLGALQRIALTPPEAAIAAPGLPVDSARSALLLSAAVPGIERRARLLRDDLLALDHLRTRIAQDGEALTAATQELGEKQKSIAALIDRKRGLEQVATAEQRAARARARELASEAKNLRDLMAKLDREAQERSDREAQERSDREAQERSDREAQERSEREARELDAQPALELPEVTAAEAEPEAPEAAERDAGEAPAMELETQQALLAPPPVSAPLERPTNVRGFPETPAVAGLVMPARGRMVVTYGKQDADEATVSKGISIETRTFAQVVAPYDGRIAYAGAFRGYGQILIIEHGGRYHTLLAGLGRIDAVSGQWVLAGEPVGTMGQAEAGDQVLYLELRRTGQPINPLPWLATTDDKVQG